MTDPKIVMIEPDDAKRAEAFALMERLRVMAEHEKEPPRLIMIDHRRDFLHSRTLRETLGIVVLLGMAAGRILETPTTRLHRRIGEALSHDVLRSVDFKIERDEPSFNPAPERRFAYASQQRAQHNDLAVRYNAVSHYKSGGLRAGHASRENRHAQRQRNAASWKP